MMRAWFTPRRLALLFLLPFLFGAARELLKPNHWFTDFEAVSCAGVASNAGQRFYVWNTPCPGAQPTSFVYAPVVARAAGALEAGFGLAFTVAMYGGLFCAVVVGVARLLLDTDGLARRAPFLAGLSASALHSGNISIAIHGLILLGRSRFAAWPALLLALVTAAAVAKPTFAVYFALFLFLDRPWWQRLALGCGGAALAGGYWVAFRLTEPALFGDWLVLARFYGLVAERGAGFLGLPGVNLVQNVVALGALYASLAALLLGAGLALAELRPNSEADRLALGIAVCLLLYPRLKDYDLYTLPVGMAVAAGGFAGWGRLTAARLAWIVGPVWFALGLIGGRAGGRALFIADCLLLLFLAGAALAARRPVRR